MEWPRYFTNEEDVPEKLHDDPDVVLLEGQNRDGEIVTVAQHRTESPVAYLRVHGLALSDIDETDQRRLTEQVANQLDDQPVTEVRWQNPIDTDEASLLNWVAGELGTLAADRDDPQLQELFEQLDARLTRMEEAQ